jgi:hypothetical protein
VFRFRQVWVDPDTPESAPERVTIQLTKGIINQWWIGFPDGVADLVHVAVYRHEHRIIPRDETEDLFWNDYIFEIPDSYPLDEDPFEVEVRVWSEDDTYRQYVVVGVSLVEAQVSEEAMLLRDLVERMSMLIG